MQAEILILKGRLSENKRKRRELSLEAKGLVALVRNRLDPFEPNVAKLELDSAQASLNRLLDVQVKLRDLDAQIIELEEALG